jgi:hypothetical protein
MAAPNFNDTYKYVVSGGIVSIVSSKCQLILVITKGIDFNERDQLLLNGMVIEKNNNILTMQSESSKFAKVLFDQIPNRRVVGTDRNAIC